MFQSIFGKLRGKPVDAPTTVTKAFPGEGSELDRLVAESQALGRQIDDLRDRRRALKGQIDALLGRARDATVQGQTLTARTSALKGN